MGWSTTELQKGQKKFNLKVLMGWSTTELQKGQKKFNLKVKQLTAGAQLDLNQPKATQFPFFTVYRMCPGLALKRGLLWKCACCFTSSH